MSLKNSSNFPLFIGAKDFILPDLMKIKKNLATNSLSTGQVTNRTNQKAGIFESIMTFNIQMH